MNTRLGKSFGLAFVVAVGILALMFALGTFNSQQASAAPVVPEDDAADTVSITPSDPNPGAAGQYTVHFQNDSNQIGTYDVLEIELEGFDIPDSIDRRDVQIRIYATVVGTEDRALQGGADVNAGLPFDVTVDGNVISLEIALDTESNSIVIPANSFPDIIFRKRAGITAPAAAGTYDVTVRLGDVEVVAEDAVTVEASISVDPTKGGGQEDVTVTGKAFADGTGSLYTQELVNPDANDDGIADVLIEGTAGTLPTNTDNAGWGIDVDGDEEADYHILSTGIGSSATGDMYVAVKALADRIDTNAAPEPLGYTLVGSRHDGADDTPPTESSVPSLPVTTYTEAKFLTDATADDGEFTATVAAKDLDVGDNGMSYLLFADANGDPGRTRFQVTGTVTLGDDSVGKGKVLKISLSGWITDIPNLVKIGGEEVDITNDKGALIDALETITLLDADTTDTRTQSAVRFVTLKEDKTADFYVKVTGDDIRLGTKTVVLFYRGNRNR